MHRALSRALAVSILLAPIAGVWVSLNSSDLYGRLWVLPLAYSLMASMLYVSLQSGSQVFITDLVMSSLAAVRLLLLPLLIAGLDDPRYGVGIELSRDYFDRGITYLAYESLAVTAFYCLLIHRLRRRSVQARNQRVAPGLTTVHWLLLILGGAALVLPGVRERYSFFSATIEGTAREIVSAYSSEYDLVAQLSNLARFAVPGILAAWALSRYQRKPSGAYVTVAAVGSVAANTFYVATSRASVFIPLLAAIIALTILFRAHRGRVMFLAGAGLAVVTFVLTLRKSVDGTEATPLSWYVNYLSTYFLGPREYAIGIRAVELYGGDADSSTLIADFVGNVPFLSGLVDLGQRTSQMYNWTYLDRTTLEGGGMIVPASVQGAFYLGFVIGPAFCGLALVLAAYAQRYLLRPDVTAVGVYVASLALVAGSLYHANSVSNVAAIFTFPILPLALLSATRRRREVGLGLNTSDGRDRAS